jgi:acetyl esterase/lipase
MRLKLISTLWLMAFVSGIALAETPASSPAKAGADNKPFVVERDIHYVPDGDASETLDIYLPKHADEKPLPLVIWIHGGGWRGGSKAGCQFASLVGQGYAAASVEYRFSQRAVFPAQIQDCQAAIRFLRANADKYHFDKDHFGVGGDSAGGHLVALVGTSGGKHAFAPIGGNEEQSDRVQAVVDFYGPADFETVMKQAEEDKNVRNIFKFNTPSDPYSGLIGVPLNSDKAKGEAVSPVHFVSKDNPPFLILHGDHDALVPLAQSKELVADLRGAGVEALLQVFPGSGHGGPAFHKPKVQKLVKTFFDKYLRQMDEKVELLPEEEVTAGPVKGK